MLGRIALALVAGIAFGIITVGGGLDLAMKPSTTKLAPALGDPNAAYDLGPDIDRSLLHHAGE